MDYEGPKILFSSSRFVKKARKEHTCVCGAPIPEGKPYQRHVWADDENGFTFHKEGFGCHDEALEPFTS